MAEKITGRETARSWQQKYERGAPRVGEIAPDFELFDSDGLQAVRLSSLRGQRPVALVFGSFT